MYDLTYGGLIEGAPNESLNIMIMERALIRHEALWGERQTYIIPPAMDVSDPRTANREFDVCKLESVRANGASTKVHWSWTHQYPGPQHI